jgi:hypothetical protein
MVLSDETSIGREAECLCDTQMPPVLTDCDARSNNHPAEHFFITPYGAFGKSL